MGNNVFTTNILTSRKGITNIKKGITNIKGRVTSDATDISGKHWQQWCTKTNIGEELQTLWSSGGTLGKLWEQLGTGYWVLARND